MDANRVLFWRWNWAWMGLAFLMNVAAAGWWALTEQWAWALCNSAGAVACAFSCLVWRRAYRTRHGQR